MSMKPRRVDFDLFHQSAEAENCYGPFRTGDFSDDVEAKGGFGWAGPDRLVWEGWFDTARIWPAGVQRIGAAEAPATWSMRLDFYVGERDLLGVGFSDNVIFRKQYYIRAVAGGQKSLTATLDNLELYLYADEDFSDTANATKLEPANGQWPFAIEGTGFKGRLGISVARLLEG